MKAGLVLCGHHADLLDMRDPNPPFHRSTPERAVILIAFMPSSDPIPPGATCEWTQVWRGIEHDGSLRIYTLQQVDRTSQDSD